MTVDYTHPPPPPTQPPPRYPGAPPAQRSWWSRNWKWVVALGCLLPILLMGTCVAGVAWFAVSAIRSSEPYTEAVDRARANPAVVERLGSPIEPKWWITGSVNINNDDGVAKLKIPISGPKGDAVIDVEATQRNGQWSYDRMMVEPESGPSIDLIEPVGTSPPSIEESADTDPAGA